jgi:ribonuclease P protein component
VRMGTSPSRRVQRLRVSGEFRRVREEGKSFSGRWLVLGVWNSGQGELGRELNPEDWPRFGVVTSRKVGTAVVRNRVRRRVREIHQRHFWRVRSGVWCVVVARFRAAQASFEELEREWCKLAGRAGILKPCEP